MKANKDTLMAVKRFLEEPKGYEKDELINQLVYDTGILKAKSMGNTLLNPDECDIMWGLEFVCELDEFVRLFSEKFFESVCKMLESFVGDEIDCYLEEY